MQADSERNNERSILERIEADPVGFFNSTLILAATSSNCENTFYHHSTNGGFPTVEIAGDVNFIKRFNLISRRGVAGRVRNICLNTPHIGLLVHSLTTQCSSEYLSTQLFDFTQDFAEKQPQGFSFKKKLSAPQNTQVCGHLMRGDATLTLPLANAIDFDCSLEQNPETIHVIGLDANGVAHETIWMEKLYPFEQIRLAHKANCIQSFYHSLHNSFFVIGTDQGLYNEKGDLVVIKTTDSRPFNTTELAVKELVPVSETQVLVRIKSSQHEDQFFMIEAKGGKLIAREMRLSDASSRVNYSSTSQTVVSSSKDNIGKLSTDITISNWETSSKGNNPHQEKVFRQTSQRHLIQEYEENTTTGEDQSKTNATSPSSRRNVSDRNVTQELSPT